MPRLLNVGAWLVVFFVIGLTTHAQEPGHVNPELDEYYAVHCQNDAVEVYRTVPERELLGSTPFRTFVPMAEGASFEIGPGVTLTRVDREYFTVSGSNGNRAPDPGEKTFTFTACTLTNAGIPVPAPTVARTPEARPTPLFQEGEERGFSYCIYTLRYFDAGIANFLQCVETAADMSGVSSFTSPGKAAPAGISWLTVFAYICWGDGPIVFGLVFVPGLLRWRHRRRRRGG